MATRCVRCKGRGLCGRPVCPILRSFRVASELPNLGTTLEGPSPPEVFVGRFGYPRVSAGPLLPAQGAGLEDGVAALASALVSGSGSGSASTAAATATGSGPVPRARPPLSPSLFTRPAELAEMGVGDIVALRSSMVRSSTRVEVWDAKNPGKLLEMAQEIAISSTPVETEVTFAKPPRGRLRFDGFMMPSGPVGTVEEMEIISNPTVPRKVDEVVGDTDLLATAAVGELFEAGVEVDGISRLLSLGLLGKNRKLVPTRWSITASDDIAGKHLAAAIQDDPPVGDYLLFSGERLANHFEILLAPGSFTYELIEIWLPRSVWSGGEAWIGADREGPGPKKGYSDLAGGYYAARLAVLERLADMRRQSAILAVREITEEYWAPLGVWVVREAARAALAGEPRSFETLEAALAEMATRLRTPAREWRPHSELARGAGQTTLARFF
ncbi:Nre family DNA repair protein [Methanothrix harundinacea]|uniref:Nre family DNA repair protein n=1 Tax=Methanothrix harundinacea TaxID=301375 RepID=UPI0009DB0527|nr:Nre family DNA repair protein [Methanothrix harundinacea]